MGLTRSRHAVEAVAVPEDDAAVAALAPVDYADAFRVYLPETVPLDPVAFAQACFTRVPAWIAVLMRVRNVLMRPFGLITDAPGSAPHAAGTPVAPGQRLGIFCVYARTDDALLLGGDDRHLDFRVAVRVFPHPRMAVVTTAVRFHNALGRAYFAVVAPFHRRVVPAALRQGLRHLAATGPP